MRTVEGRRYVRLINRRAYATAAENLGFTERCAHVEMLAKGAPGYAVLCTAAEPTARSREIVSFDGKTVFRLGPLTIFDGDEWAEVIDRIPVRAVR